MKSKTYDERFLLGLAGVGLISLFLPWVKITNTEISLFDVLTYIFKYGGEITSMGDNSIILLLMATLSVIGVFPFFCYAIHIYYVRKCNGEQICKLPNFAVAGSVYALTSGLGFGAVIYWMIWKIREEIEGEKFLFEEFLFEDQIEIKFGIGLMLCIVSAVMILVLEWNRNGVNVEN